MGFIPNSSRNLTAYLTQKGREYLVAGDKDGFTIKYFALGDPDVNYLVASQPGQNTLTNMLPQGLVPDISGDDDGAIHSLAGGVTQRYFLSGGANVKSLGTNLQLGSIQNLVRFQNPIIGVNLTKLGSAGFQQLSFVIPMEIVGTSITGYERVKVYLLPPSQGTSPEIYGSMTADIGSGGVYGWVAGAPFNLNATGVLSTSITTPGRYNYVAKFRVVPFKSALTTDPDNSVITVNVTLTVNGVSSSSGSIGIVPPLQS